ncbi:Endophilin-A2 [Dermatophagoides pteronyssinus]|uniref:Endophilin-A n=1 Tax=Dermatophagoides pteronyssinus TaxID=6956 RepID=A0ABQ8JGJ4_DERPT|nr:Endophilin-A2 [Dermatophagoides pteronyssinus]
MNEKIGGVEGTKFTDEFTQLERRTDLTYELVDELINRTKEYLQPNPGILADAMCKYGKEIDEESNFAKSLSEMGEALREMAEVKYALEDNVKQNFLEPLTHLQAKDLKDVLFHRKKLEGRRLDYDCKKRKRQKGTHFSEEEIRMAEEKLEESYNLASMGMHNILQNEIEQLSQICVLAEALYEYHSQCANILESLNARLMEIKNEAAQRTFQPYEPKKLHELNLNVMTNIGHDDLSPGDAQMMNGSKFFTNSCDFLNKNDKRQNAASKSATISNHMTTNASSSTHSSPLSIKSGKFSNGFSSNNNNNNNITISPSMENPPNKPTNLFLDTSKVNANGISAKLCSILGLWFSSPLPSPVRSPARTPTDTRGPCCQALYDFDAENENELNFKEGDIIQLVTKVDDNWYEGSINGRTGLFPVSYVQVLVPI